MKAKATKATEDERIERVNKLLGEILDELRGTTQCGESDTEYFMVKIAEALGKVDRTVRRSHREGLCYNCLIALSWELCELYPRVTKQIV